MRSEEARGRRAKVCPTLNVRCPIEETLSGLDRVSGESLTSAEYTVRSFVSEARELCIGIFHTGHFCRQIIDNRRLLLETSANASGAVKDDCNRSAGAYWSRR